MANTRGKTSIHGPSATGTVKTTSPPGQPQPHPTPNVINYGPPTGGGATPTHTGSPTTGQSGVNAGTKTTVNTPGKKAAYGSGTGVGANTAVKRKKARRLGTNHGDTPA